VEVIFKSGILKRDSARLGMRVYNRNTFWRKYVAHSVLTARPLSFHSLIIRAVADRILHHQYNDYTNEDFREFVTKLCWLPVLSLHFAKNAKTYLRPCQEFMLEDVISSVYFKKQLLSAAAYVGDQSMVKELAEQGLDQYDNK
jgi:hypothetical protein